MSDYIEILKEHLKFKMIKNPNYSMRAFARDLELSPGLISGLMTKKIVVSLKTAKIIARKLNLDERSSYLFLKSIQDTHNKQERKKTNSKRIETIIEYHSFDQFEADLLQILKKHSSKNITSSSVKIKLTLSLDNNISP